MKATIKRLVKPTGDHFFMVYADGQHYSSHWFRPGVGDDEIASEKKSFDDAMIQVKIIESDIKETEELIYETGGENNIPPELFSQPQNDNP